MVSFDEFKDVRITTATNSDGEQICMYVCMLSITNLLVLPGGLLFLECDQGVEYGFFLMCPTFGLEFISFKTKNLQL